MYYIGRVCVEREGDASGDPRADSEERFEMEIQEGGSELSLMLRRSSTIARSKRLYSVPELRKAYYDKARPRNRRSYLTEVRQSKGKRGRPYLLRPS